MARKTLLVLLTIVVLASVFSAVKGQCEGRIPDGCGHNPAYEDCQCDYPTCQRFYDCCEDADLCEVYPQPYLERDLTDNIPFMESRMKKRDNSL